MRNLQITPTIANRDNPSVEKYFSEISRESLITAQEEVSLAAKIRQGDKTALEKLIRSNLRFVVSVAQNTSTRVCP
jgi:RNA polymerase primary sigma factor